MLTSFKVTGLWGHQEYPFDFHEDLNIITGSNGTGKTTLLKLIWYMLSGHLKQAFLEVNFARAELVTKTAIITLQKRKAIKQDNHPIDGSSIEPGTPVALVHMKRLNGDNIFSRYAMPMTELDILLNTQAPSTTLPSLFFPTFRRVEGGFSFNEGNEALKIVEGFKDFSKRMSHQHHQMIAFADFDDVRALINETSSDIRAKLQPEEDAFMAFISSITKSSNGLPNTQELQHRAARLEQRRRELGRPLGLLSRYIDEYFLKKSVGVTDELRLGTHSTLVKIESLSAGEKNLLSFLVYAMSMPGGVMFIDEPELTLHHDWQSSLLPILKEIAPATQFVVATHSPAVYSSFPDKDFWLDARINEEVAA